MLNKNALYLSIFLTLIEIIIFFGFCTSFNFKNLFNIGITNERIIPYLPNIFIAIVTTWYVIFTYYILKSNEIIRKLSTQPYLFLSWDLSDHLEKTTVNDYSILTNEISASFSIKPKDIEHEKRYVNLSLQNIHQTRVGKIAFRIKVTVSTNTNKNLFDKILNYQSEDLNLGFNDTLKITVLDLKAIPKNAIVYLKLIDTQYNPIDSPLILTDKAGADSYECFGITELEEVPPKPQIEIKGR
jgi:hypothetical protein